MWTAKTPHHISTLDRVDIICLSRHGINHWSLARARTIDVYLKYSTKCKVKGVLKTVDYKCISIIVLKIIIDCINKEHHLKIISLIPYKRLWCVHKIRLAELTPLQRSTADGVFLHIMTYQGYKENRSEIDNTQNFER